MRHDDTVGVIHAAQLGDVATKDSDTARVPWNCSSVVVFGGN